MDYEKKYNNIVDTLQSLIADGKKQGHIIIRIDDIENAIPELKELEGEKKPVYKAESKFEVGDWITFYGGTPFKIVKIEQESNGTLDYLLVRQDGHDSYFNKKCVDENARLWTIHDAKPGDVLVDVYGNTGIFQKNNDFDWTSYCSLGVNGGFQNFKTEHENDKTHPATEEQRDNLMKAVAKAGCVWDDEKKHLYMIIP